MERLISGPSRRPAFASCVRATALLLAAVATAFTVTTPASAQTWKPEPDRNVSPTPAQIAEAKARYEKGVKLYEEEANVQAALVEFERAYDLAPNYKVLYNIGQGARTLRDYASALRAFEAYLEGGQGKLAKPRVAEVQREIAQLRTYVATLTIQVDVDGAIVALDNVNVGTSPLPKPLLVNAGRMTLTASKAGRVGTVAVTLAGGDVQTARVELPAAVPSPHDGPRADVASAPLPLASSAAPPPAPPRPTRTVPYLALGIGATLGASAGITGFAALRSSRNLEDARFAGPKPSREAEDLRTRTQRLSVASDVLTGAAIVSAAVGVVLLVLEPSRPATTTAARRNTLKPFATPNGAGLSGVFLPLKERTMTLSLRRFGALVLAGAMCLLASSACQLVVKDDVGKGIGETCATDGDCQAARCDRNICAASCTGPSECPAPSMCTPSGTCQLPLKVGFVYVGGLTGELAVEGWTLTHEQGRQEAMAKLPYLQSEYVTDTFIPEDIANAVDKFVTGGAQVVVANSFSQRNAIKLAATKYPDVKFLICSGNETGPNVGTYFARMEQAYYIAGYVAAQVTKTKRLGFVGSYMTPEVVRHANAFTRGARRAKADIVVEIRWEGFWFDLNPPVNGEHSETRLAKQLMASGCDVLAHNMDNGRVVRAVEAARLAGAQVYSIGNDNRDACNAGPTSCLGTSYWSWGTLYAQLFDEMHRKQWDPSITVNDPITDNPATTTVGFAANTSVTGPDLAVAASELSAAITRPGGGNLAFAGPYCSTGQRAGGCVAEGETVSDEELTKMCWFVEGIVERSDPADPKSPDKPAQVPERCLTQQ